MADDQKDIWNDEDGEERSAEHGRLKRFLIFLLVLVLVLAVVMVAAWRDGTGFDAIRRWISYGGSTEDQTAAFDYDADRTNRFAVLGGSLLVASNTNIELLGEDGAVLYSQPGPMNAPSISVGKSLACVVDSGGTSLTVLNGKGMAYQLTADTEAPFITATMNSSDWLAVTAEKKSYKGCVSVYDPSGELVFTFDSSDRYVIDACVSADNQYLAAVTLGQENGTFLSSIVLYPLEGTKAPASYSDSSGQLLQTIEPSASYSIRNALVLQIGNFDGCLTAVSDTCLTFAGTDGKVKATYDYAGRYLREYDLGGDGYVALLLNRSKSGSTGQLVTVNTAGEEVGTLSVKDQILNISAAGRYLAVLYSDSLVLYTPDLLEYARLEDTGSARDVLMRKDGSAVVAGSERAELYLP